MDAWQLRCFLTVAAELSYTRAAARLGVTQPGVSYQIAGLEENLGVKLFARAGRAVCLTEAGLLMQRGLVRACGTYRQLLADSFPSLAPVEPDLRLLRTFQVVADCRSFTRAGDALFRTQSVVSHQVASLEELLQARLLDRSPQQVELTPPGAELLGGVRGMLLDYDDLVSQARTLALGPRGGLKLGLLGGVERSFLPRALRDFTAAFPSVTITTHACNLTDMVAEVRTGGIDCGFTLLFGGDDIEGVETLVLAEDHMVLVVGQHHPLARRKQIRIGELRGEHRVSSDLETSRQGVEWHRRFCRDHGLDPALTEYMPDFPSLYLALESGRSVAILPRLMTEENGGPRLRYIELEERIPCEMAAVWKAGSPNPVLQLFLQFLRALAVIHS